jgi:hypothetical protein
MQKKLLGSVHATSHHPGQAVFGHGRGMDKRMALRFCHRVRAVNAANITQ